MKQVIEGSVNKALKELSVQNVQTKNAFEDLVKTKVDPNIRKAKDLDSDIEAMRTQIELFKISVTKAESFDQIITE
jgi:hypothetical protein